jgi:hypothetical protein
MSVEKEYEKFIKTTTTAIMLLCKELEKHYPGISNKEYNDGNCVTTFAKRMQLAVYMELIKSGEIK